MLRWTLILAAVLCISPISMCFEIREPLIVDSATEFTDKDLLKVFLARVEKEGKPGVIIVVPKAGKDRGRLCSEISDCFRGRRQQWTGEVEGRLEVPRLFDEVVIGWLSREQAGRVAKDLPEDICLIPVLPNGKAQTPIKINSFAKEFVPETSKAVLDPLVEAQEKALGERHLGDLREAINKLTDEDYGTRAKAAESVAKTAPKASAILAKALRDSKNAEQRKSLRQALAGLPQTWNHDVPLPVGIEWEKDKLWLRFLIARPAKPVESK